MPYKRKKGKSLSKVSKTNLIFKGITYKSKLEVIMAMCLYEANIPFKYESETIILIDSFSFPIFSYERSANGKGLMKERVNKKIQSISYTPDFVGEGFYIETKGYANETFSIRWKLFKRWLIENNYDPKQCSIYKPQTPSECKKVAQLIKEKNIEKFLVNKKY
jgi:hypothetical protein